jgi:hypothetical protein
VAAETSGEQKNRQQFTMKSTRMSTRKLFHREHRIGSSMTVSCETFVSECMLLMNLLWIIDGEGYVEDGREIFDDAEDYEVQSNSNKRKSNNQKKRGSKLPDEPVSKKKSLKNFFAKESKEKEAASVEDDNLLKNILDELDGSVPSSSKTGDSIAPKPIKSIRKQATESEIEMKKYMEKFGKKANEKKKSDVKADVS